MGAAGKSERVNPKIRNQKEIQNPNKKYQTESKGLLGGTSSVQYSLGGTRNWPHEILLLDFEF